MNQKMLFAKTIDERFAEFHAANPHVYDLFKRFAWQARRSGRRHYGAKSIFERIRWHIEVETDGGHWKLDNSFTSRYVRMLIDEHPEFDGFFETRRLRS